MNSRQRRAAMRDRAKFLNAIEMMKVNAVVAASSLGKLADAFKLAKITIPSVIEMEQT